MGLNDRMHVECLENNKHSGRGPFGCMTQFETLQGPLRESRVKAAQ